MWISCGSPQYHNFWGALFVLSKIANQRRALAQVLGMQARVPGGEETGWVVTYCLVVYGICANVLDEAETQTVIAPRHSNKRWKTGIHQVF